jgi:hypothetical protein
VPRMWAPDPWWRCGNSDPRSRAAPGVRGLPTTKRRAHEPFAGRCLAASTLLAAFDQQTWAGGVPESAGGAAPLLVAARAARPERADRRIAVLARADLLGAAGHTHAAVRVLCGLATAVGAGVSMSFSEGVSDTGEDTGRGNPRVRGAITGTGTFIGGFLHTLPFLIPSYTTAIVVAILVVMLELGTLASCGCGSSTRASARRVRRCDHRCSECGAWVRR